MLAIYDGDAKHFPAGSSCPFCAYTAAKTMAAAAAEAGAGKVFSLAVVFARCEYETWLIAGVESLSGRRLPDGRLALPAGLTFPGGDPESHGKGWLVRHQPKSLICLNRRPNYSAMFHQCPWLSLPALAPKRWRLPGAFNNVNSRT